jgi:hypothetical protein
VKTRSRFASLIVLCGLSCTTAFAQENRGTAEQQAACAPDAFRLCSSYIPDPTEVAGCLRQRRSELSGSCRSVFDQADRMPDPLRSRRLSREY